MNRKCTKPGKEKADLMIKDDPDYIALKESWKKKKRWGLF